MEEPDGELPFLQRFPLGHRGAEPLELPLLLRGESGANASKSGKDREEFPTLRSVSGRMDEGAAAAS